LDAGVCVDDIVQFSGDTWNPSNRGEFRVIGVDQDSLIIENPIAVEQLHRKSIISTTQVQFTAGSPTITGSVGAFDSVDVGMWVKSSIDGDDKLLPVVGKTSTTLTLLQAYSGTTGLNQGTVIDQMNGAFEGIPLMSEDDIKVFEADSMFAGDTLFVESIVNSNWFSSGNSGTHTITEIGVDEVSGGRPYMKISNVYGLSEPNRSMSVKLNGFYVIEAEDRKYSSYREVNHAAISSDNSSRRSIYLTPASRQDKISQDYGTKIDAFGKMGFEVSSTTGVDGYLYYTGLMRTVQRTIDGYEPDQTNFPGRRAVGSAIEVLPSLIKKITIALAVTTKDGVNLNDVSNEIKSAVITYVSGLGVGEDVILSEVTAAIMDISGVAAVTFTTPSPTLERITIAADQRAYVAPEAIFLS